MQNSRTPKVSRVPNAFVSGNDHASSFNQWNNNMYFRLDIDMMEVYKYSVLPIIHVK